MKIEEETKKNMEIDEPNYTVFYADSEEEAKAIAFSYFQSMQEKEKIVRPKIPMRTIFFGLIFPLLLQIANILVYFFLYKKIWFVVSVAILIFLIFLKTIFVLAVLVYQKIAPVTLRNSCRFEPSCSEYMLLAIKKYGFIKGVIKGIKRLGRCHYPNGGEDYP